MKYRDKYKDVLNHFEKVVNRYEAAGEFRLAKIYAHAVTQLLDHKNAAFLKAIKYAKRIPPDVDEFINSEEFLGGNVGLWPAIEADLKAMCPDTWIGEKAKTEVILTGATAIGKTIRANMALALTMTQLTCFDHPHFLYGLMPSKPIILCTASAKSSTARENVYKPVKDLVLNTKHFKKNVRHNDKKDSEIEIFGQNILFKQFPPDKEQLQGHDIIAMSVEEANSMLIVQNSKKVQNADGSDGIYDQAHRLISEARNRRQSRFMTNGPDMGGIYVVSSANHENDYVSCRRKQLETAKKTDNIIIFDQRRWDVVPPEKYPNKETFFVLVSTKEYSGQIFHTREELEASNLPKNTKIFDKSHTLEEINAHIGPKVFETPIDHLPEFEADFDAAQRDVIGISSATIDAFIKKPEKVNDAMQASLDLDYKPFTDKQNYKIATDGMPIIIEENLPADKHKPRILHIDIATNNDRAGISMAKIIGNQRVEVLPGVYEDEPVYQAELAISIEPSKQREVDIEDLRNWAMSLRKIHGLNIVLFSFDQHQSKESRQKINKAGFKSNLFSTLNTPESYEYLKKLLYTNRIVLPHNWLLKEELAHLQKNSRTGKVDHAPGFSNDIADALASAVYQHTMLPSFRRNNGIYDQSGDMVDNDIGDREIERREFNRWR